MNTKTLIATHALIALAVGTLLAAIVTFGITATANVAHAATLTHTPAHATTVVTTTLLSGSGSGGNVPSNR